MPTDSSCPDPDQLRQFMLGLVGDEEAARLEDHLRQCARCDSRVDEVAAEDALVVAMRARRAAPAEAEMALVDSLLPRLRHLQPPRSGDSGTDTDPLQPGAAGAGPEEWSALLAPPEASDEIGRLGPYGVLKSLGSGGMGVVFLARQARPQRLVALKMVLAGRRPGRERLARFRSEADLVARLRHPNVVQVHEAGEHDGRPYYAMELVEGGSLADKLAAAPLAATAAARLVQTLARAVQHAHEKGVVHRDLKPSNVLLTADGTPKVTDFGLAKQLEGEADVGATPPRTESGAILGTPGYMAPEQAGGRSQAVGPAADVYALGAILYECLTGRPPFKAATVLETLEQVRSQEPVPISRLQPKTPRDLQTVCLKCLHKEPARRYASAADLADDLGRFLGGEPIRARPVSARERLWKWARRKPALAALVAVSGLSLAALVVGDQVYSARLRAAVKQAEASAAEAREQRSRADAGYRTARDTLDRMLRHLERRRLGEVPQLKELQRDQCEDALAFFQGVFAGADDPDPAVRLDAARAYQRAATIQARLSRYTDAVQNWGRAIDLVEALPAAQRDQYETQELLAVCYSDRGFLSPPPNRDRFLGKALEIKERLAQEKPDDPGRQNALAATEHQLGQVLVEASRLAEAEAHYRRAVAIRTRLIQDHPQEEGYQEALAGDYVNLGLLYAHTKREAEAVAMYKKIETLLRPLIARHPEDVRQPLTLAAAETNWGLGLLSKGQSQAAVARCTEAVKLAEGALQREPSHYMARGIALNAHGARAQSYEALGLWAEAARDRDRVVELDEGPQRWTPRVFRALARARAGDHARAVAEAETLAGQPEVTADGQWELARVHALSVKAAHSDTALSTAERDALAERYAAAAVALLQKLQEKGYFKDARRAKWLDTDPDWQPLRGRADFRKLLAEVRATGRR
jgi:serine/threonine-protein kinase